MINEQLLNPRSIAIIGASNDRCKPGGKVMQNILAHGFDGPVYPVNPKEKTVQGLPCYSRTADLPEVDLAIVAVAAPLVEEVLSVLTQQKNCKAFILFSAGFGEAGVEGRLREQRCVAIVKKAGGTLIGPNCIGVITGRYKGVFAGPVPLYDSQGCDCVSASGATMVYLLEMAIPRGLRFRDIFSIGNGAQVGVEDVLQYWDETFDAETSARIKLLYLEQITDPQRFLKHARSLVQKGCRIAAIKAGSTEAGERAVSSHTGALAGNNAAVSALFRKAGIIRCYSRVELVYVAAIFTIPPLKGNRLAVITHAGGPGVMLTDVLVRNGMQVPNLSGPRADALLKKLHPGSSVANPIDFLATGNAAQLSDILDAVENDFDVDGAVVVFGTTGMWPVDDVYQALHEKMCTARIPIFPILPSAMQAAEEVSHFLSWGHVNFTDEVSFGYVLSRVYKTGAPFFDPVLPPVNLASIRSILDQSEAGFLPPGKVVQLLRAVGITVVPQAVVTTPEEAVIQSGSQGFPLVMKVVGPVHKTDVGGVVLNVSSAAEVESTFLKLISLPGAEAVLLQQQTTGLEIFLGAKSEGLFGHLVLCGLGGIFVEVFKDVSAGLSPISTEEALSMIRHLKGYALIRGTRGKPGVSEKLLAKAITRICALLHAAPEIVEMDINPLMGNGGSLIAVDARVQLR